MTDKTLAELRDELERLNAQLTDRKAALPAHSMRPNQLMEIEELEEKIKSVKQEIESKG